MIVLLLVYTVVLCNNDLFSFSGTRGARLDNEHQPRNKHMPECEAVTPLQADTSASELRHHPNQNSANEDLLSFPGTKDILFDREPDYVNNPWDYNTPDLHGANGARPLKVDVFASKLRYHSDQAFVKQLPKGITESFEIGYLGPECSRERPSLNSARVNSEVVSVYLQIKLGRVGGAVSFPLFLTCSAIP